MRRPFFLLSVFALVAACSGGGSSSDQGGAGGDIAFADTLGAMGKTLGVAVGVSQSVLDDQITQGKVVTLRPMSARDRRVIHLSLAKLEGVTTSSSGEGMRRRIQIIPARTR